MSIRHEAVRLLEGDEPRTESNIDRIVRGLLVENYTLACEKYAAEYAARLRGDTMSDDLLDEATRLADEFNRQFPITAATLRALVERVRAAEAARQEWADLWQQASMSVLTLQDDAKTLTRERDAARGKLDTVRALAEDTSESVNNDWGWGYDAAMESVLAILDDKTGD